MLDRLRAAFRGEDEIRREIAQALRREFRNSQRGAVQTRDATTWTDYGTRSYHNRALSRSEARKMRGRARSLCSNNPLASGILSRDAENVIGSGFKLQARTDSDSWNEQAEEFWKFWWHGQPELRGYLSGGGLEYHIRKARQRDGDVAMVLLKDGRVQLLEADLIESPVELLHDKSGKTVVDGVEVSKDGRPVAYYVRSGGAVVGGFEYTRIAARNVLFYPRLDGAFQFDTRGTSAFGTTFPLFDHLDGYVDATVMAARMAAIFGLLIKKTNPTGAHGGLGWNATNAEGDSQKSINLEPGMVNYLGVNEDIAQVKAEHPGQSFPEFVSAMLRLIGQPFSMPLEVLALDYSRTNYSSARAALEQYHRAARIEQQDFAGRVLGRLYRWRVTKAVMDGDLPPPPDPDNYWTHKFIAPGWPYLDPVKEIQAAMLGVEGNMSTLSDELAKVGKDFDEVTEQRRKEIDRLEELDLPDIRSSLGRDGGGGETPGAMPEQEDDDEQPETDED